MILRRARCSTWNIQPLEPCRNGLRGAPIWNAVIGGKERERDAGLFGNDVDPLHLRLLQDGVGAIGSRLDRDQIAQLARHVDLLLKWNRAINLTAITEPAEVIEKHVLDSLALAPLVPAGTLLDAGTGAGFPGLPIRIARPDVEVMLVDSVQKKVAFLKSVLAELRIGGVRAIAVRLQGDPAAEHLARVHAAVARAFADPVSWLKLAQPYILANGLAFCMLGPADPAPERQGDLVLQRELAYRLPFSQAERRIAAYKHV